MQTFKERVQKNPESPTRSKDMVDDLLIVNGYRIKMVSTC